MKLKLVTLIFAAATAIVLSACSGEPSPPSNSSDIAAITDVDSVIDMQSAESNTQYKYEDYYEINTEYNKDGKPQRADVYSPEDKVIGYRIYEYASNGDPLNVKTYDTSDRLKSTLTFYYAGADSDVSGNRIEDASGNIVFRQDVYTRDGNDVTEYYGSDNKLILRRTTDKSGNEKYADADGKEVKSPELDEKLKAIEDIYCEYLY